MDQPIRLVAESPREEEPVAELRPPSPRPQDRMGGLAAAGSNALRRNQRGCLRWSRLGLGETAEALASPANDNPSLDTAEGQGRCLLLDGIP
jgi:hypothetical protein